MPRKTRSRPMPAPALSASPSSTLTDGQVNRWADLIADGRDTLPDDLPPPDQEWLLAAVRPRLRGRMVRLVARAIAARLHRQAQGDTEVQNDA